MTVTFSLALGGSDRSEGEGETSDTGEGLTVCVGRDTERGVVGRPDRNDGVVGRADDEETEEGVVGRAAGLLPEEAATAGGTGFRDRKGEMLDLCEDLRLALDILQPEDGINAAANRRRDGRRGRARAHQIRMRESDRSL